VVVLAVLVTVELAEGVAAAATAPGDSPISTSNANEAANHTAPVATANPPSFCTAAHSMRRDRDMSVPIPEVVRSKGTQTRP
jgi:hypothetical protein